jgi:hypothetical protein
MRLQLADNAPKNYLYNPKTGDVHFLNEDGTLSGKRRQAKRAAKRTYKAEKKAVKRAGKLQRRTQRQDTRTQRSGQRQLKRVLKPTIKAEQKKKKLIRVKGKQEVIKARNIAKIREAQRSQEAANDFEFEPSYGMPPGMPQSVPGGYNTDMDTEGDYNVDGGIYGGKEFYGKYEQSYDQPYDEQYDDSYYDESYDQPYNEQFNEMSDLSFFPGAGALIRKAGQGIKKIVQKPGVNRAVRGASRGVSQIQMQIQQLKKENEELTRKLEKNKTNTFIIGASSLAIGSGIGYMIGRSQ